MSSPSPSWSSAPPPSSPSPEPIPPYTLFDPTSVGIAAFLGTPIAGTALMALNYRRVGKPRQALWTFVIGVTVTLLVLAFGYLVPAAASTVIAVTLFVATYNAAKSMQATMINQHLEHGGQLASRWAAAGVGIGAMVLVLGGVFVVVYAQLYSTKIVMGSNDTIYYSGTATKQDAQSLGEKLKSIHYFTDKGASVFLAKNKNGTIISFAVKDGAWNQPNIVAAFEEIGREAAPSVGGFPLTVRLVNDQKISMKELTVGRLPVGTKDEIFYLGMAREDDAKALAKALQSAGYFHDNGVSVFLSKNDTGTELSFVVTDGAWNRPGDIKYFEDLAHGPVAPLLVRPFTVLMVNSHLESKRVLDSQ